MRAFGNRPFVLTLAGAVLFFLYAPIVVIAVFSFNDSQYTGLPFNGFTLRWYAELFQDRQILGSIWNSVYVGLGVVAISVFFGLPAAIALDRYAFPGKAAFRRIVLLTGRSFVVFAFIGFLPPRCQILSYWGRRPHKGFRCF